MTPSEALAAPRDDLGELAAEQAVLAATAGRLAAAMGDDTPPYALAALSRELSAPPVDAGMSEAEWDRI